ncbi:hypothetical protein A6E01_19475 (plasmid) [Vibrio breoganii]|uniref:Uncharacterized protein n=1 Tax=Vibrio breoganii TaxID=553239 RepID=A0AAN0XZ88_9VIBR|nr:hypothetical protein [Vibrio breoganii]ANO35396.1 hypothetical protein A6E01_19475 [Vibrio breoganii]
MEKSVKGLIIGLDAAGTGLEITELITTQATAFKEMKAKIGCSTLQLLEFEHPSLGLLSVYLDEEGKLKTGDDKMLVSMFHGCGQKFVGSIAVFGPIDYSNDESPYTDVPDNLTIDTAEHELMCGSGVASRTDIYRAYGPSFA